MCVNTQMIPIEFYRLYREWLFGQHGNIHDYFISGENAWPQNRMDFTAMGAYAHKQLREKFTWYDVENGLPHPPDRKRAYHSHSGFVRRESGEKCDIRAEIEKILNANAPHERPLGEKAARAGRERARRARNRRRAKLP